MRRLYPHRHAKLGEAPQVTGVDELRVLDAPAVADLRERVQRDGGGQVADGVHGRGYAVPRRPSHHRDQLLRRQHQLPAGPQPGVRIVAVRGPRVERPVHEQLAGARRQKPSRPRDHVTRPVAPLDGVIEHETGDGAGHPHTRRARRQPA